MGYVKSGTLVVRNLAQKVLFDEELKGQLSDGQWENAEPWDHWEQWCNADVVVAKAGEPVGRDFWVKRQSYGFTRREFLDGVGDRMLAYVRVALRIGYPLVDPMKASFSSIVDYATRDGGIPSYATAADREAIATIGIDRIKVAAANAGLYSDKDMAKDLADLQRIIKVVRDTYAPTPEPTEPTDFLVRVTVPLLVRVSADNQRQAENIAADWYLEQGIASLLSNAVEETVFYGPGGENASGTGFEVVPE